MRGRRLARVLMATIVLAGGGIGASVVVLTAAGAAPRTADLTPNGQSAVLTFIAGGQTGTASVQGLAGQQLTVSTSGGTFALNCGLQMSLLAQNGSTVVGPTCAGQSGAVSSASLPSDGLFRASFSSGTGATGSVTVKATSSGGPRSISFDAAPVTVSITTPSQDLQLGFTATIGDFVSVSSAAGTLPDCNVSLRFVDKLGAPVGTSLDPCAGASGYAEAAITKKATYFVKVLHNSTNESGTLHLFLTKPVDQSGTIIADGTSVAVNPTQQGENARFTFSGTTGQRVAAQLTSSTFGSGCPSAVSVALVRPNGSTLGAPASTCTASLFLDPLTLDQTGTWTVLVDPQFANTGSATLAAFTSTDETGVILRSGSPKNLTLTTPGKNAAYTFTGAVGQQVSALLTASTIGAGCPAVVLSFVRPDATQDTSVSTCSDSAFLDSIVIDQNGTWTILVDPQAGASGTATLQAFNSADQLGLIHLDASPTAIDITSPGQNARWHFAGTTGGFVSAQISSATFAGCPAFTLSLERPDGSTLGAPVSSCNADAVLGSRTLDQDGTWNLVVDPQGTATGTATLEATSPSSSDDIRPITINGAPLNVTLAAGENGQYTFSGTDGQLISAQVMSSTFPGCTAYTLWLKRPDSTQLGTTVNGCGASAFLDRQKLDMAGTWTFVFTPQGGNGGTAQLQAYSFVDETGTAILTGKVNKLALGKPGENARFTFSGTTGQGISVDIGESTIPGCPAFTLSLERPNGTAFGSTVSTCTAAAFLDQQKLDATGTWTVVVDPQGPSTGIAMMRVYDVVNDNRTLKPKVIKSFTALVPGLNGSFSFDGKVGDSRTLTISLSTFTGCPALIVSFVRPNGTVFSSTSTCNADLVLGPSILDSTGTWKVALDPQGSVTGTLIIRLT